METENTWFTLWLPVPLITSIETILLSPPLQLCSTDCKYLLSYGQGSWLSKEATKSIAGADKPLKRLSLFKANELFVLYSAHLPASRGLVHLQSINSQVLQASNSFYTVTRMWGSCFWSTSFDYRTVNLQRVWNSFLVSQQTASVLSALQGLYNKFQTEENIIGIYQSTARLQNQESLK